MAWEDEVFAVLDELEQQAEAAYDRERELELADRSRAEYASVTLASRMMASVSRSLVLEVAGVGRVEGVLERVGDGWCLLSGPGRDWVVRFEGLRVVHGASERSVPEVAWSAVARLGVGSALRGIADTGGACRVHLLDGAAHDVRLLRVGRDFVEGVAPDGSPVVVATAGVAAVQRRE